MNFKFLLKIGLTGVVFHMGVGEAAPMKSSSCQQVQLKEAPGNSGYFFSEDCSQVYVLPPRIGHMEVKGHHGTGNTNQICSGLQSVEKTYENYLATEEVLSKLMRRNAEKIEEIQEQLESGLYPIGMSEEDLMSKVISYVEQNQKFRTEIMDFSKSYVERLQHYAQREGSAGTFIVENTYNELISEFKRLNKGLNVKFSRLPLDQSYLSIVDRSSRPEVSRLEMSAVLEMKVPGIGKMPLLDPASQLLGESSEAPLQDSANDIFGDALSGEIRFSSIGACGVVKTGHSMESFSLGDIESYISANAVYEYQVQVKRHHSITYNLSELFKKIQEQTKRGGFFSRKTIHRLIEDKDSDSWLTFHSESEDVRFDYTEDYIREIKKEFIDRALRQVIAAKAGGSVAALSLLDPSGDNGSEVIGSELSKCPLLYCQIGAAGFKVLNSIFGSTTAMSELIQTFDANISETVLSKKMVKQVGTMTFK